MKRILRMSILLLVIVLGLTLSSRALSNPSLQEPPPPALIEQLERQTEGKVRISYHAQTGKVRFIGTDPAHPIPRPAALAAQATPEEAARQFLATYGRLFGLTDQANELTVMRTRLADRGRSFTRFQQLHQGVPVMGGELIVQADASKNIVSANGEILPDLAVDVVPTIDAESARQTALAKVAKGYGLSVDDLTTTEPELWIYNPILLGGPGLRFNALVWRMEVEPKELMPIRELVLVDAHLGAVTLHFNQIDTGKNRKVYDAQNTNAMPGVKCRFEGEAPSGTPDCNYAYDYAGNTYDFYYNTHGRDSIDGAGMDLISTVRYCDPLSPCPYANAFWNGSQMVYGQGYCVADDVVAHEMTHGVTQYESNLFYYYQSGAINEAFSDIWGEFVDLTNGAGNDAPAVRWLCGEDLPGGAIRSLKNPPAYNDPDKISSGYYWCLETDNGGVHTNSGVGNKAAYLLVDGDTFNGQTVTGIGMTKTAKIFYEVQTNIFTSASDYADLYDALSQACANLIGTSGITAADCQEVQDAVDATEMNQQPSGCPATEAPICDSGSANNLFFDDMENTASGNWSSAAITGYNTWYYPQNSHPFTGFDATYATSGVYNIWGYDYGVPWPGYDLPSDCYIAMTSNVALPGGSTPYLHFNHAHGFEDSDTGTYWDGGIVEYSVDGGFNWNDVGGLFTHNGYNGTIFSGDNPLAGRSAFVDDSHGYYSSRLDLSSLAGQNVRFRFRLGMDSSNSDYGWFIDDVRIYTCGAVPPTPTPPPADYNVYLPLVPKNYSESPPDTFYSQADACVLEGYPTMQFGDTSDMMAGYDDYLNPDGKIARSLIQFNVSAIPSGTSIDSALLQVYLVGSYDFPGRARTITAYRIGSAWSELSVTWPTQPSCAEAYGSASVTHSAWAWYAFDVTDLVRGWVNGTLPNYGIMLRGPEWSGYDSSWRSFSTREGPYTPQLAVTYSGYTVSVEAQVGGESLGIGEPARTITEALTGLPKSHLPSADLCQDQPPEEKCLALQ